MYCHQKRQQLVGNGLITIEVCKTHGIRSASRITRGGDVTQFTKQCRCIRLKTTHFPFTKIAYRNFCFTAEWRIGHLDVTHFIWHSLIKTFDILALCVMIAKNTQPPKETLCLYCIIMLTVKSNVGLECTSIYLNYMYT